MYHHQSRSQHPKFDRMEDFYEYFEERFGCYFPPIEPNMRNKFKCVKRNKNRNGTVEPAGVSRIDRIDSCGELASSSSSGEESIEPDVVMKNASALSLELPNRSYPVGKEQKRENQENILPFTPSDRMMGKNTDEPIRANNTRRTHELPVRKTLSSIPQEKTILASRSFNRPTALNESNTQKEKETQDVGDLPANKIVILRNELIRPAVIEPFTKFSKEPPKGLKQVEKQRTGGIQKPKFMLRSKIRGPTVERKSFRCTECGYYTYFKEALKQHTRQEHSVKSKARRSLSGSQEIVQQSRAIPAQRIFDLPPDYKLINDITGISTTNNIRRANGIIIRENTTYLQERKTMVGNTERIVISRIGEESTVAAIRRQIYLENEKEKELDRRFMEIREELELEGFLKF